MSNLRKNNWSNLTSNRTLFAAAGPNVSRQPDAHPPSLYSRFHCPQKETSPAMSTLGYQPPVDTVCLNSGWLWPGFLSIRCTQPSKTPANTGRRITAAYSKNLHRAPMDKVTVRLTVTYTDSSIHYSSHDYWIRYKYAYYIFESLIWRLSMGRFCGRQLAFLIPLFLALS